MRNTATHSNCIFNIRTTSSSRRDAELNDWEVVENIKLKEKKQEKSLWHWTLAADTPTGIWTSKSDTSVHTYWAAECKSGRWWESVCHCWSEILKIIER